jgi:hypothetical protein
MLRGIYDDGVAGEDVLLLALSVTIDDAGDDEVPFGRNNILNVPDVAACVNARSHSCIS